ncbi:MAG: recombinase RecA, partial [Actinomycetota bacterium]
ALAIWFMDDGSFSERSKGLQERTAGGSGRVEFCVEAMSEASRVRLADLLRDVHGVDARLSIRGTAKMAVLTMTTAGSSTFLELVAPYVHPSMDDKLLPRLRGQFAVEPQFVEPSQVLVPARVLEVKIKPPTRSMHRFDIEVAGTHNYFVDGVMVHNSPETTTGGKALKFYASVRLDVRRIETLKDGTDAVGNRTRVKVVKNKLAPPFKQAEFDIIYGLGISREGGLIDMGVEHGFVRKAGAWYTYEGDQLGQGKENARSFLKDNPDLADELEKKIKEKLGVGPQVNTPADPIAAGLDKGVSVKGALAKDLPANDVPVDF